MEVTETRKGVCLVVELGGRLDSFQANELKKRFLVLGDAEKRILVDCTKLEYISSAGLGVFLLLLKTMGKKNGEFYLCGLNDHIREVFVISGFHKVFTLFGSQEQALAAFNPS